jgi:uncharacterized protein YggE
LSRRLKPALYIVGLLLFPVAPAGAQAPDARVGPPVVVTSGEGLVQAVPDRAWIAITAETRASNPREAQRRNVEAMRPVQDRLRGAGIPADAIRTIAYDLQQEWDFTNGRRTSRGYVARNSIEVRVDAVERVGELLELAVGSGATSVSGLRWDLKDRAKLEREAVRLAVADARGKADAAAAGAGRAVERIIRIEEHGTVSPPPPIPIAMARQALESSDAPPIYAGQIELRARVTLTGELK